MAGSDTLSDFQPLPATQPLFDQEKVVRFLSATLKKKTIPHALLFTGIEGVGKQNAALAYAMACNCLTRAGTAKALESLPSDEVTGRGQANIPCGVCKTCGKILSGQHPDIIFIKPSARVIKIAQIRDLCRILTSKPYEARVRAVIISDADRLNAEAGNALLKILEEPPGQTIFMLTALQASDLLATIVSRCQQIRFNPISVKSLIGLLIESYGLTPEAAGILAKMANGSLSKARIMCETDWLSFRNCLINEIKTFSNQSMTRRLLFAERLCDKKERLPDALDIFQTWFRDLIVFPNTPNEMINKDMRDTIAGIYSKWQPASLHAIIEAIGTAQKRIEANANVRLVMDTLMMQMAGVAI